MKLVIDVDKDYVEILKYEVRKNKSDYKPFRLIANGIPLEEEFEKIKENINFIAEKCLPNNLAEEYEVKGLKTAIKIIDNYIKENE